MYRVFHWKGTLQDALLSFVQWKDSLVGVLSCFLLERHPRVCIMFCPMEGHPIGTLLHFPLEGNRIGNLMLGIDCRAGVVIRM